MYKKELFLKDYIHLYLGCDVLYEGDVWKLKSVEIGINGNVCGKLTRKLPERQTYDMVNYELRDDQEVAPFKLILRPLSDMLYSEAVQYLNYDSSIYIPFDEWLASFVKWQKTKVYYPDTFLKLVSRRFDFFELLETNLAVNKMDLLNSTDI